MVFFPRYRIDDPEKMSTSECIENFNINFSKGGRFEKYASDMEYDENNPIKEENIVNRAYVAKNFKNLNMISLYHVKVNKDIKAIFPNVDVFIE